MTTRRIVFRTSLASLAARLAVSITLTGAFAVGLSACGEGDSGPKLTTGAELQSCAEDDFRAAPLMGAGYNPESGFTGPVQESYIAHTTFLILRPEAGERFNQLTGPIIADLETREGLIAYSLGSSEQCGTVRTMGIWASQEAMYDFVLGPAHSAAMAESAVVGENGATTSWEVLPDEIPMSWDLARRKIGETTALY
ncbi:MAG: hypothetical protein Tsb0020_21830 [Haliangiales bacterium]